MTLNSNSEHIERELQARTIELEKAFSGAKAVYEELRKLDSQVESHRNSTNEQLQSTLGDSQNNNEQTFKDLGEALSDEENEAHARELAAKFNAINSRIMGAYGRFVAILSKGSGNPAADEAIFAARMTRMTGTDFEGIYQEFLDLGQTYLQLQNELYKNQIRERRDGNPAHHGTYSQLIKHEYLFVPINALKAGLKEAPARTLVKALDQESSDRDLSTYMLLLELSQVDDERFIEEFEKRFKTIEDLNKRMDDVDEVTQQNFDIANHRENYREKAKALTAHIHGEQANKVQQILVELAAAYETAKQKQAA